MTLITTAEIIDSARRRRVGAGAFNVIEVVHAVGIVKGAERIGEPVILQVSENTAAYHGAIDAIGAACLAVADSARVPVAVHLDHATTWELVERAVRLGFSSVMFDASALPYEENVAATAEIVRRSGVFVEAELGKVGGKDGVHAPGVRTDPAEAAAFVEATGVDALAVAVGTSHAMVTQDAELDFELITRLRETVEVPLVLHGSSGVPDAGLVRAVRHGMTKINIATQLNVMFTAGIRGGLTDSKVVDPRHYLAYGRASVAGRVQQLLEVLTG
ncbi:class II fructose-bisphosphate aldolase [Acrocarpospora macrocephala]|uniref:Fructose-bisphosphate aldolase n=1 Tax=Acrocarpospora macrocephala TaxID=150177 RepID=A0A5M3WF23_9ACTN|nr:class II fructose-bisphosphate aldolase [Acrocarpospora macrocephala]GES06919.1 fructose-bisphosphate aldolase [Acrocarpospora macrocephala]